MATNVKSTKTKNLRPTSAGVRGTRIVRYKNTITTNKPIKSLVKGRKNRAGRNSAGRITVRHQGGGNKKNLRDIDFMFFDKAGIPAKVEHLEYDPHRSGFIARVVYADGERRYMLAPQAVKIGTTLMTDENAPVKPGNRLPVSKIPVGTFVYNIELKPKGGAKIARSAGVFAEVVAHDGDTAQIKMPSSEVRIVSGDAWASVGEVSNPEHRLRNLGKAGRSRHMGIRPTVRGSAMNPVDHPHGGGEGKQGRGHRRQRTMWGKPSGKGQKTRKVKKYSDVHIVSRRKVGKRRK